MINTVPILVVCAAIAACQALEPTNRTLREPPLVDRDPTAPTILEDALPPIPDREPIVEPPPLPPPRISDDVKRRLEFRGTSLAGAVQTIAESAQVNVYFDPGLDAPIDAIFPAITLDDALQTLLTRNQMRLVELTPGIFHVESTRGDEIVEHRFELRNARAAEVELGLKAFGLFGAVIVADIDANFILVRGPKRDVALMRKFVEGADRLKQQVLIEMRIAEVAVDETFDFGARIEAGNIDVGDGTVSVLQQLAGASQEWSTTFMSTDGDLDATLRALDRVAAVDLLSAPRVVAVDNSQASIQIVREVPYIQTTTDVTSGTSGGVGTSTTSEVAFKEVGVRFTVTPSIRENGVIEFDVDQELSEVADFLNGVPAVNRRQITSRFQVRDRETLVVGGLMQDRRGSIDSGVPSLMDIPFLGALFKRDEDDVNKREMLVFLTPRIIDLADSRGVTDQWRQVYGARRRELGLDPGLARERAAADAAKAPARSERHDEDDS